MQNQILASFGWIFDIAFFAILFFRTFLGARRGFVVEICKSAGKIASIIFAIFFCVSFANFLEKCFGMTTAIANGIASSYSDPAYTTLLPNDVSGSELSAVLESYGVGAFSRWLIGIGFSEMDIIPAGTTAALLISSVFAKCIAVVISFILLILLIRLFVLFLSKFLTKVIEKIALFCAANQFLGALIGFLKAAFWLFVVLTLFSWLPLDSLFESSLIVGNIIRSTWFRTATSYAISGKWFSQFLSNQ